MIVHGTCCWSPMQEGIVPLDRTVAGQRGVKLGIVGLDLLNEHAQRGLGRLADVLVRASSLRNEDGGCEPSGS